MIKSFAARAIVPVSVTITGFVVLGCLVLYSFISTDLQEQDVRHERDLTETVLLSMRHSMMQSDREGLRQIIRGVGEAKVVTHLRVFSKRQGTITFSADPTEVGKQVDKAAEGCVQCHPGGGASHPAGPMEEKRHFTDPKGRPVLALMVSIPNLPECSQAACHAHDGGEKVLGTLDIGLSQEVLHATLGRIRLQMAVFCVMVMFLSVVGVSALLWRRVFLPIKELVAFSEGIVRAKTKAQPVRGGDEIESIIRGIQEMADVCHEVQAHMEEEKHKGEKAGK